MDDQTANPIGEVHEFQELEEFVTTLAQEWDKEVGESRSKWWKFWSKRKANLFQVTKFLLKSMDSLIQFVDGRIDFGPDKKATVLSAIEKLYDYIIREAIPIWLRPFAERVKIFIIFTVISTAIDWIVEKYHKGQWDKKVATD